MGEERPKWIDLDGAHNTRDLGDLPARGGRTRPGVLLRSDALDSLTVGDVELLVREVGLNHVIDLRTPAERAERGRGLLETTGIAYSDLEIFDDHDAAERRTARFEAVVAGHDPDDIMAAGYLHILEVGGLAFATALERIVAPRGAPVLVHCAAGKDRTGVLVALLLEAAGVDPETIVADYAATQERMGPVVARLREASAFHAVAQQVPAFVYEAAPETMHRFLVALDERWGGAAAFLVAHGTDPVAIESWREILVEPGPA